MDRYLNRKEIDEQSTRAFERWKGLWFENAEKNSSIWKQQPDLRSSGKGRTVIILAFGPSFEKNIKDIKNNKLHHYYDIMCVDKALRSCLDNNIIPKYVIVCDAQVNFEKYGKINPDLCQSITLISTITANYKWAEYWTRNGGKVYFTVNKDGIRTQDIFRKYLKNKIYYFIPAASNVANSTYVVATLVLNYSNILLAAFDYSYSLMGSYYGDVSNPADTNHTKMKKHSFNDHYTMLDISGNIVQVSQNMDFSAKWLMDFINGVCHVAKINTTINVTEAGILNIPFKGKLLKKEAA